MRRSFLFSLVAALSVLPRLSPAAEDAAVATVHAQRDAVVAKGVAYLKQAQAEDGSFSAQAGPGVTALAATALMKSGLAADDPVVAEALKYVEANIRADGGIYAAGSRYRNYETSLAIMALVAANDGGKYDDVLKRAETFIKKDQWDVEEGHDKDSPSYGGAGYGSHSRPDLSNTSYLLEALEALDVPDDDPAVQRALVFVSRCQNLDTKYNDTKFAALNPDGGFYYTPAAGGTSQAGANPNGGLRSYGSMTYAGLKSMLYAGVDADDPRVKAAVEWAKQHYTLEENPGMGEAGLYYYFHTFAKALATMGEPTLTDDAGVDHDWRQELVDELASRQRPDGSWINKTERWLESDPNLVTGYALLALSYCQAE